MVQLNIKKFLEAGVHFGHQTKRWNPKMKPYIFGEKNKIHIIDLQKTLRLTKEALDFIAEVVKSGEDILMVGTKRQAQVGIVDSATRCNSFYVNHRWLGGMLTNFSTVQKSVEKMQQLRRMVESENYGDLTKKEIFGLKKDLEKLEKNLAGIEKMEKLPGVIFIVDPKKEHIALREANKLNIPAVVLIDTNCDPDGVTYPIPGNDDAIRSIGLIASLIADVVIAAKQDRPKKVEKESEVTEAGASETDSKEKDKELKAVAVGADESPVAENPESQEEKTKEE